MRRQNLQSTFTYYTVADLGGSRATAFFDQCQRVIPIDRLAASGVRHLSQSVPRWRRAALADRHDA